MENQSPAPTSTPILNPVPATTSQWTAVKVYSLGAVCLVLGILLGALFHGPAQPTAEKVSIPATAQQASGPMPPMSAMNAAAAPEAADPIFEKVKSDPNNVDLLRQAGVAAMKAGTPKAAEDYYDRALKIKDDPELRVDFGNACFRAGDGDKALSEFAIVLKANPKNDKALYNSGVVRLMAKNDPKGAIECWQTLLKYYPDHPHKDQVLEMIKRVKSAMSAPPKA